MSEKNNNIEIIKDNNSFEEKEKIIEEDSDIKNEINQEKKEEKTISESNKENKSNQTFENNEKKIEYLEQKIQEQNIIINELNEKIKNLEIKYSENEIIFSCKLEVEKIFSIAKNKILHDYQNNYLSMKTNIRKLSKEIENQLRKKDKKFKEKTQILINKIENLSQKEKNYINQIEIISSQSKDYQKKLNNSIKERVSMEDIIIRQEEKLNILIEKVNKVEEIIKRKNRIIKENEAYAIELIKIIEQQKNKINEYKTNHTNNIRLFDKSKLNNYLYPNFNNYNTRNKAEKIEKNHFRFFSMDGINENNKKTNKALPTIVNSISTKNINFNNIQEDNNDRKINEFKSMVNKLVNDIEN